MGEHKARMLRGELYRDNDPDLVEDRERAQRLCDEFNRCPAEQREPVLRKLLGALGEGSRIMPRFQCDYGYLIEIGSNSFLNYDAILMDCAPIASVMMSPSGRRRSCSPHCIRWRTTSGGDSAGKRLRPSRSGTTCGSAAGSSCAPA
jgi:hypothetical protein